MIPLREGTGPVVRSPDRIAVDYLGQVWGAEDPVRRHLQQGADDLLDRAWAALIKAWDKALVGLKEGARVLIVCPPGVAYGTTAQPDIPASSTLVYVVDVLGVG